jgi:multiple sugar transport system permease protein
MRQTIDLDRATVPRAPLQSGWRRHMRRNALAYWLILPSLVFLLTVEFYPLGVGLLESLYYHNRVQPFLTHFNGIENFVKALSDFNVRLALRTSAIMVVGIVSLSYLLGLVAGLLLNQNMRLRGVYRALMLVPWVVPPVVAYISWQWMLNDQSGIINHVLASIGLIDRPVLWLADPNLAMVSLIVVGTWSRFPFMMITVLAALSAIPDELYEAGAIDGATTFALFRHITLPLILPVSAIATLLQAIWIFNDFGLPFVLTGGGPANATTPLILLAYREAFQRFNIGYGTSLAVIAMVFMLGLGAIYMRLQSRQGIYEL